MSDNNHSPHSFRVIQHKENDQKECFLDVAFPKFGGGEGQLTIARGTLLETGKARVLFANHGAIIPDDCTSVFTALIDQPAPIIQITAKAGWHERHYLSRFGCLSQNDDSAGIELDTELRADHVRHRQGSMAMFNAGIKPLLAASPYLLFAYLLALAAPLAARIGLTAGFSVCFSAQGSTGKTSCLRLAQALVTRADESDLESFGHTTGVMLDRLPYYGGQAISFGDLKAELSTKAAISKLDTLVFTASGGTVRERKGEKARPKPAFNILIFSAEKPLHDLFSSADLLFDDGEAVRLLDIPVPDRASGGIFAGSKRSSGDLVRDLHELIDAHHGVAMESWIRQLAVVVDVPRLRNAVVSKSRRFVRSLGVLPPHHERIADHYGLLAATASLAIRAGKFATDERTTYSALSHIFWSVVGRIASRDARTKGAWTDFFSLIERLPELDVGEQAPMREIAGFRRPAGTGAETIFVRRDALKALAGEAAFNTVLLPALVRAGCLPATGEKTVPVKQAGLDRVRYFPIDGKFIGALREQLSPIFTTNT